MTHLCWQPDAGANIALRAALCHWLIWTRKRSPSRWRSLTRIICGARPSGSASFGPNRWQGAQPRGRGGPHRPDPGGRAGTTDQHSQVQLYIEGPNDKVFTFWAVEKFSSAGRIPKRRFNLAAFDALAGRSLRS